MSAEATAVTEIQEADYRKKGGIEGMNKLRILLITCTIVVLANIAHAIDITSCSELGTPGIYDLTANITHDGGAGGCINITGARIVFDCHNNQILGSQQPDVYSQGINVSDTNHILVRNCYVSNFSTGIGIHNSENVTIQNSTIFRNILNRTATIVQVGGAGISVDSNASLSSKINITGNNISENIVYCPFPCGASSHGGGIFFTGVVNSTIENNNIFQNLLGAVNIVEFPDGAGVSIKAGSGNVVQNNKFSKNRGVPLGFILLATDLGIAKSDNNLIVNNDFQAENYNGTFPLTITMLSIHSEENIVRNNNFRDYTNGVFGPIFILDSTRANVIEYNNVTNSTSLYGSGITIISALVPGGGDTKDNVIRHNRFNNVMAWPIWIVDNVEGAPDVLNNTLQNNTFTNIIDNTAFLQYIESQGFDNSQLLPEYQNTTGILFIGPYYASQSTSVDNSVFNQNFIMEDYYDKVIFALYNASILYDSVNFTNSALNNDIVLGNNSIFVNANVQPLNKSALLRFYFLGENLTGVPQYSTDGINYVNCDNTTDPSCTTFNSYIDGSGLFQANFVASHFSFYRLGPGGAPASSTGDMALGWASLMLAGAFFTLVAGVLFSLFRRK